MRPLALSLLAFALLAGCGGDEEQSSSTDDGDAQVETTDAGTKIIRASDERAGLDAEIQDDGIYIRSSDDAPAAISGLEGQTISGSCEDDGGGGVEAATQFPIYWRDDPGDWGSALARANPEDGGVTTVEIEDYDDYEKAELAKPRLSEHVTRCEVFAPDDLAEPVATFEFRGE